MKIAVFGATGRTGRPLVEQALAAGHEVVALVRTPARLPVTDARLTIVQGDVTDSTAVTRVVRGCEAVISVVGQTKGSPADLQTAAMRVIVEAMHAAGVRRLVSLTGAGVDAPQDKPKLINHVVKFALRTVAGHVLRDAIGHVGVIQAGGPDLDWTIVRAPRLTDGPHTGQYRVGWVGVNTGVQITRADVADFLLKEAVTPTPAYLRQLPMVSA